MEDFQQHLGTSKKQEHSRANRRVAARVGKPLLASCWPLPRAPPAFRLPLPAPEPRALSLFLRPLPVSCLFLSGHF